MPVDEAKTTPETPAETDLRALRQRVASVLLEHRDVSAAVEGTAGLSLWRYGILAYLDNLAALADHEDKGAKLRARILGSEQ